MAANFVTSVICRSHQQDCDTYCGMATVMMVLNALDPSVPPLLEDDIKAWIPSTDTSNAPPCEVAAAIENHKPASWNGVTFAVSSLPKVAEANKAIVRALYDTRAPVATQVNGASHWLVVTGALTDSEPAPFADYKLLGLFVHNPKPLAVPRSMAHADTDACGHAKDSGQLDEFISTTDWTNSWFTGTGAGNFVSVPGSGTPPPPSPRLATTRARAGAGADAGARAALDARTQAAVDAIEKLGLNAQGPCAHLLACAVPSPSSKPGGGGGDDWFVTLYAGGKPTATARVADDTKNTFLGVGVTAPGGTTPVRSVREMADALTNRTLQVHGQNRDVCLTAGDFTVRGPFSQASREAPSPYDPLYEIRISGNGEVYYTTLAAKRLYTHITWYDVPPPS